MMLPLAAAAVTLLAAEPSRDTAVVSVIWPGAVAPELGERIETDVRTALAQSGVHLTSSGAARMTRAEAQACGMKRPCFTALAARLGAGFAVRIEPAAIAKDVAVLVQAFEVASGRLLSEVNTSVPVSSLDADLAHALVPLVAALAKATAPPAAGAGPPPKGDAPLAEGSKPEVGVEARRSGPEKAGLETSSVEPAVAKGHGTLPWVFLGAGVLAGVAGGVFAGLGASARSSYLGTITTTPDGLRATSLTAAGKQAAISGINFDFTVALSSAIAAVVLAGVGAGFFALE